MRLSRVQLKEITGYQRRSAQAAWFMRHLGVTVPCDDQGPIITEAAYQALLDRKLGLRPAQEEKARPKIQLVRS